MMMISDDDDDDSVVYEDDDGVHDFHLSLYPKGYLMDTGLLTVVN